MNLVKTNSKNPNFQALVQLLDAHFKIKNGEKDKFFAQYNKIAAIKYVVLAYENNVAVACGSIKQYSENTMEIKRMFTLPEYRGQGIASKILAELESWARELGYSETILETLKSEENVVDTYRKNGYKVIPNYGQYVESELSVCMQKTLK
jgi:putative acetyltransferase